jgi:hypothetical protein
MRAINYSPAGSALALLVTRIGADDHHATVPADDPALLADALDGWLYLHRAPPGWVRSIEAVMGRSWLRGRPARHAERQRIVS